MNIKRNATILAVVVVIIIGSVVGLGLLTTSPIADVWTTLTSNVPTVTLWTVNQATLADFESSRNEVQQRFNAHLDLKLMPDDFSQLSTAIEDRKDYPDIILANEGNFPAYMGFNSADASGQKPLLIALDRWNKPSQLVLKQALALYNISGHQYGLPGDMSPAILMFNDKVWKSFGIDISTVKTWDDYFFQAKRVCGKQNEGNGTTQYWALADAGLDSGFPMFVWAQQIGIPFSDRSGQPVCNSPKMIELWNKYRAWFADGMIYTTTTPRDIVKRLTSGQLLATIMPSEYADYINQQVGGILKTGILPAWKPGGIRTTRNRSYFMGITRACKNPQLCYNIMAYLLYDQQLMKKRSATTERLPPMASLWTNLDFGSAFADLKKQNELDLFLKSITRLPTYSMDLAFSTALNAINNRYYALVANPESVESILSGVQSNAMWYYSAKLKMSTN